MSAFTDKEISKILGESPNESSQSFNDYFTGIISQAPPSQGLPPLPQGLPPLPQGLPPLPPLSQGPPPLPLSQGPPPPPPPQHLIDADIGDIGALLGSKDPPLSQGPSLPQDSPPPSQHSNSPSENHTRIHLSMKDANTIEITLWYYDHSNTRYQRLQTKYIVIDVTISTEMLQDLFSYDVRKDGNVDPRVHAQHTDAFRTMCGFTGPYPPKPWDFPSTELESKLADIGRTWIEFPNLLKNSTSEGNMETQVLDATKYQRVGVDCGPKGTTVFAGPSIPETMTTVASTLDTASTSIAGTTFWPPLQSFEDYKKLPNLLTIETSVCDRLGLPIGSYISNVTRKFPADADDFTHTCDYYFSTNMFPGPELHDTITAKTMTTPYISHEKQTFKQYLIGNTAKNKKINVVEESDLERAKYLLFKELSDMQGLFFLTIFARIEELQTVTLSVDKVWLLRAMVYDEACLCTGVMKDHIKGCATYHYYDPRVEPYTIIFIKQILKDKIKGLSVNMLNNNMLQMYHLTRLSNAIQNREAEILAKYWINYITSGRSRKPSAKIIEGKKRAGTTPVGPSPVGASPVGTSPVGSSQVGTSPVGSSSSNMQELSLDQLANVLIHTTNKGISDDMIRSRIKQQIDNEIASISLNIVTLLFWVIYTIKMIDASTGEEYSSSSSSKCIPQYNRDTSYRDESYLEQTKENILEEFQQKYNTLRESKFQVSAIESFVDGLLVKATDLALMRLNVETNFLADTKVDPLPLGGPKVVLVSQSKYINSQFDIARTMMSTENSKHYVTVIRTDKYFLNYTKFLLYDEGEYTTAAFQGSKTIGPGTLLNTSSLLDLETLYEAPQVGGSRRLGKSTRLELKKKDDEAAKKQAETPHKAVTRKFQMNARKDQIAMRQIRVEEKRQMESHIASHINVEPMSVLLFTALLKYIAHSDLIDERRANIIEFIQIFYDVLVDLYSNNIYDLARYLILKGYSEEEINEVGSLCCKFIQYNGESYSPLPPQDTQHLYKLIRIYKYGEYRQSLARGRRYKTKKIKQRKQSKKSKQRKQSKQSKQSNKNSNTKKSKQSKQSKQSNKNSNTKKSKQSKQSKQSNNTKKKVI